MDRSVGTALGESRRRRRRGRRVPIGLLAHRGWPGDRSHVQIPAALATALPAIATAAVALKLLFAGWLARVLGAAASSARAALAAAAAVFGVAAAVGAVALLALADVGRAPFAALVLGVALLVPLNRFAGRAVRSGMEPSPVAGGPRPFLCPRGRSVWYD